MAIKPKSRPKRHQKKLSGRSELATFVSRAVVKRADGSRRRLRSRSPHLRTIVQEGIRGQRDSLEPVEDVTICRAVCVPTGAMRFVGDSVGASIVALDPSDRTPAGSAPIGRLAF